MQVMNLYITKIFYKYAPMYKLYWCLILFFSFILQNINKRDLGEKMQKIMSITMIGLLFLSGIGLIPEASSTTADQWTVMYYLNGDNLISVAQGDHLNDIRTAGSTDQVNVAVLIDQAEDGETCLYYLDGNDLVKQDWPSESNSSPRLYP